MTEAILKIDITKNCFIIQEFIIPYNPFLKIDLTLVSSFIKHKIKFFSPSNNNNSLNSNFFNIFYNHLLDIHQTAKMNLQFNLMPKLFKENEILNIFKEIKKNDDFFLFQDSELSLEEKKLLLIEFFDKNDENLSFLWFTFLTGFSQKITSLFSSFEISKDENDFWNSCICNITTDENKKYFLLREQMNNVLFSHRNQLKGNSIIKNNITHCSQYKILGSELPIFIKETILQGTNVKNENDNLLLSSQNDFFLSRTHLVILVHGLEANSSEMNLLKNYFLCSNLNFCDFFICKSLENNTHQPISVLGNLIISEILEYIKNREDVSLISFVSHSLGSLIVRSAIESNAFSPFVDKLHTFISLSSPHLGVYCGNGSLMSSGIWLWKNMKVHFSSSFSQMTMSDSYDVNSTFLYRLSKQESKFRNYFDKI